MTTITIEQSLLEQAVESFVGYRREMRLMLGDEESEPCDVEKAIRAALTAPATAPEPVAWMSPKRFYRTRAMALINGEQLIEPLYLRPPATAPDELERLKTESEERLQNCAALVAEVERLRKDAERYQWLAEYLVSDDESYDDAIVAATTVAELDYVTDAAMKGTP